MSLHYASIEAERKFPGGGLGFARVADALLRERRADEAMPLLAQGVRRHPDYIAGYLVLGRACKDAGRIPEAKAAFENALRLDGRCPAALSLLAWIEETQKESADHARHAAALAEQEPWDEDFQAAVHRIPVSPEPAKPAPIVARVDHFAKSNPKPDPVALNMDEDEDFEEDEDAGDAVPHVATVTLAEIYFQQGLKDQALQIYRQLLERQPNDETVKKRLMEIEASTA